MPYSAGTAWLQVKPSFRNIEGALARDVAKMAAKIDAGLRDAVPDGVINGLRRAERDVASSAHRTGQRYAGAFHDTITRELGRSLKALPEPEIGPVADRSKQAIRDLRNDMEEVLHQHLTFDIDDRTLLAALEQFRRRMREMERTAGDRIGFGASARDVADLRAAQRPFETIRAMAEEARHSGAEAGGNYGGAFGRAVQQQLRRVLADLPEIHLTAVSTPAEREIARIRGELERLSNARIGIDIEPEQFMQRVRELDGELGKLRESSASIPLRYDIDRAREDLRKISDDAAPEAGAKSAERFGGAFQEGITDKIERALRSLPAADVRINDTQAKRELETIRGELAALRDLRIGVDIDAGEALARMAALQARLIALSRERVDIQVSADTLGAAAQLAAVDLAANSASRSVDDIGGAANSSLGRLGAMIAAGLSIGTSIVPAAAAAAAAIGAIATSAFAAGAAIGISILAFSGVVTAVKALDKYQGDQAKSAKSLAAAQTSVANAADSVASAERGLANTREQVAEGNRRAARSVADAERQVTQAKEANRQATLDLIKANEQARRQDEDRALQLEGLALDQRQAQLDLKKAKTDLDKVLKDPKSTKEQREQAQLTYDQQVLHIKELSVQQKRLAQEQADSKRKGVQGSDVVVAAQKKVTQSAQGVRDAEQKVADAREAQAQQARQGAFQIANAQQSVIAAQRQLQQATVNAGVAGGEALQNLDQAMQNLSPTAQRFSRYLFSLKEDFLGLRGAAEEGLLPGVEQGLRLLLPLLPSVEGFIRRLATAMGVLFVDTVRTLQNPVWRQFFSYMSQDAVPALAGMVHFGLNVATGLAAIINALRPFNAPLGRGLIEMSEGFARWATALRFSAGYREFIDYVRSNGPTVVDFFKQLAIFVWRFIVAAAPIGSVVLKVLDLLASGLNAIPTWILTALIAALGLLSLAILANGAVMRTYTTISQLANNVTLVYRRVVDFLTGSFDRLRNAQILGLGATREFTVGIESAGTAAEISKNKVSGFASFLSGGIYAAAIGVALYAITKYVEQQQEQKQRTEELVTGLMELGDAYKRTGNLTDQSTKALILQNKQLVDLIRNAEKYGISVEDIAKGAAGDPQKLAELDKRLADDEAKAKKKYLNDIADQNPFFGSQDKGKEAKKELEAIQEKRKALKELSDQLGINTQVEGALAQAQNAQASATQAATEAQKEYADAQTRAGDAMKDSATKADLLRQAYKLLYDERVSQQEAMEAEAASLDRLEQSYKQNGTSLDISTAQGRANIDALEDRIQKLRDLELADIAATGTVSEDTKKKIKVYQDEVHQMGFNEDEVKKLEGMYGLLDVDVITDVILRGGLDEQGQLSDISQQMIRLIAMYNLSPAEAETLAKGGVPTNWRGPSPTEQARGITNPVRRHTGGAIHGPGTETSDSIPALLSDDEHVWTAKEVRAAGGHGAVEALRKFALQGFGGLAQRFATGGRVLKRRQAMETSEPYSGGGGQVGGEFSGNADITKTPSWDFFTGRMDQLMAQKKAELDAAKAAADAAADGGSSVAGILGDPSVTFPPWPSSPGASRGDSGVWKNVVALIKSTGPISGSFGNSYRDGDPLWHGSGRAVDWMGYQQDALAAFLASRRPLELIHRTAKRDYAFTRGKDKGSFHESLMEAHRNHVHIAMDEGGLLQPGWNPPIWNGTGQVEPVLNPGQWQAVQKAAVNNISGPARTTVYNFRDTTLDASRLRAHDNREAALARVGRAH